ncbi:putative hydrolase of the HAD superfamily [Evansella vedderi]|uniref:Hydrolase of the HAD superfamily n=1 Tax=Evansella vedderi TaxID=38282 RepID=A0ABT9ZT57_9BACI|nr:HAD family hydrolase [Evansella vedderi]MDQ0254414.1 putative hydrolase of the HAD superfamily [Evansella vedderi]
MRWKGICFDLDNTLFSHEEAFKSAIEDSFHTYILSVKGIEKTITFDQFFKLFKWNSDRYWNLYEQKKLNGTEYRRKRFNETMKELGLPFSNHIADKFHAHYYEVVDDHSKPYSGLKDLMNFLTNRQVKLGIITNGMIDTQFGKVEKLGASNWIPTGNIIVSEEVGVVKPQREIFRLMEQRIQLPPKELLFIGDSWLHDVAGAIDAGWEAIFLNTRGENRKSKHEPTVELHTLEEVKDFLIDQLGGGYTP